MTTFDTLRLDTLVTSPTNPRKNFNPVKLQELADSIAGSGVHQPILVRPLPAQRLLDTAHLKPRPTHEVVAGERRYRASQLAKVDTIPAMIRDLTDDQVLEIQIVENIQRDSLTELETAEGYQLLIDRTGIKPEEIGLKVGKSRSSVYGSLKLLDLHPYAKDRLRYEFITASAALLIARIADIELQNKAVDYAAKSDDEGHKPSIRTFQAWLRDNVMLDLTPGKVPFPTDIRIVGAFMSRSCKDCTKRTGHDPDLFADVKTDMCTNPPCYHIKVQAHKDALAAQVAAIPKTSNRNVDEQHDLGLVSTLAQQMTANPAQKLAADIERIKVITSRTQAKAVRLAVFDKLADHIKATPDDECSNLLTASLVRAWLGKIVAYDDNDDVALILGGKELDNYDDDFLEAAHRRIEAATNADLCRFAATYILLEDRNVYELHASKPADLFIGFAKDRDIDLHTIAKEVEEDLQADMKEKIAAINKQIKAKKGETIAPKTTSTPPPAGAAIGTGEADAKKPKTTTSPAGASRKAKTTAQEAISGIAAAMQSIEAEPTGASLEGSGTAVDELAINTAVNVLDGKHKGRTGRIVGMPGSNSWSIELYNALGMPFATTLPTKSLEVIA